MKPSGHILAEYRHKKQTCDLPSTGGYKEHSPIPGNWAQAKRLERLHEAHYDVISELRVAKNKQLAKGTLVDNIVEIEGTTGPYWRFIGFSQNSKKFLLPEEAVYLMESSCLEVFHQGLPLSSERLYSWMLRFVAMEEFLAYSHLMRLGYVVRRYEGESAVTEYERKINLDQHLMRNKRKKSKGKDLGKKMKIEEENQDLIMNSEKSKSECEFTDEIRLEPDSVDKDIESDSNLQVGKLSKTVPVLDSDWKCQAERMLNLKTDSSDIATDLYNYTVGNVCEFMVRDLWSFRLGSKNEKAIASWPETPSVKKTNAERAFGTNEILSAAKNWNEYKTLRDEMKKNFVPPTQYLWDDVVLPLNSPENCRTIPEIRKNLQIIQSVADLKLNSGPKFRISYDLYTPAQKSSFKKSGTSLPAYRIVVMKEGSQPPELVDIVQMRTGDGVPLLWSVTDNGNVHFYSFEHVEIPEDNVSKK